MRARKGGLGPHVSHADTGCGGELYDHAKKCIVRDCRCYGIKDYLLRSCEPLGQYLADAMKMNMQGAGATDWG